MCIRDSNMVLLSIPLGMMWTLELINMVSDGRLVGFCCLYPRTLYGSLGIFSSPFVHWGMSELMTNSLPFLLSGLLIMSRGVEVLVALTCYLVTGTGVASWLLSPSPTAGSDPVSYTHLTLPTKRIV
eukprot:TRINITY_DN39112_c0_g2_i2.p2 TRINITY_DN39112_c0_g2~~TRINITY_DN39112_c0_g2_i2.p2  ORF type:complete len:127 (-),score=33.04 TRINITY_DN39112_c0_g2_i2:77-457(-)